MRAAFVGCGKIARAHANAVNQIDGAEIVALCDRDLFAAEKLKELAPNARTYADVAVMLAEAKPDVVHIMTPPRTHAPIAKQVMDAGANALVEKPMALTQAEADEMIEAAERSGVKLCATHNYLFKPSVSRALELVKEGAVGDVLYVNSYYGLSGEGGQYSGGGGRDHWASALPGGVFTNFLPHLIYIQLALLTGDVSVQGVVVRQEEDKLASELTVLLQGDNASGVMAFSTRIQPYAKFVEVYGSEGIVRADLVRELTTIHRKQRLPRMLSKASYSMEESLQLALGTTLVTAKVALGSMKNMPELKIMIQAFYDSIRMNMPSPVPGEQGREVARIMEDIWSKNELLANPVIPDPTKNLKTEPVSRVEQQLAETEGWAGKKVMVTGATGFLGYQLVAALARTGADVTALVRNPGTVSEGLKKQAKLVGGDLRTPEAVAQAVAGAEIVFHCAAITTNSTQWSEHEDVNIKGTEAIFKAAVDAGVRRIVHVSSVAVYGMDASKNGRLMREQDRLMEAEDPWAYYVRSKLEAEDVALQYADKLDVTIVRLGILYGPGGGRAPGRGLIQVGPLRFMVGTGGNHLPYTYIDNAVDAVLLAGTVPEASGQTYNIVDEPQMRLRQVARKTGQIENESLILVPIPTLLLLAAARFFERRAAKKNAVVPPKLTQYVLQSASRDIVYDTQKAEKELGWSPEVKLDDALRETLKGS
jgi:predicted dehydrogenase/nucleoside-diphosphate-sugar epimerase